MNLETVLKTICARIAELDALTNTAEKERRRHQAALVAVEGIRRCEDTPFFGSTTTVWAFVASCDMVPKGKFMTPVRTDLVVVPNIIARQMAPRSTPDPVHKNISHVSFVEVSGDEAANHAVAVKNYGLRIGTEVEIATEKCPTCQTPGPTICQHEWDYDNAVQSLLIYRLCTECPDLTLLASAVGELDEDLIRK